MLLAIALPIIFSVLVGIALGEIQLIKYDCPPHHWSRVAMSEILVCMTCNKESHTNPFI